MSTVGEWLNKYPESVGIKAESYLGLLYAVQSEMASRSSFKITLLDGELVVSHDEDVFMKTVQEIGEKLGFDDLIIKLVKGFRVATVILQPGLKSLPKQT